MGTTSRENDDAAEMKLTVVGPFRECFAAQEKATSMPVPLEAT
jgi:hypothetical protein